MVAALRPGGWLVVEDFDVDFQPCADARRVDAAAVPGQPHPSRVHHAARASGASTWSSARKLPRLFRDHGLVDVAADAYFPLALPAAAAVEGANVEQVRDGLVGLKVASDDEIDAYLAARGDRARSTSPRRHWSRSWGRRAG